MIIGAIDIGGTKTMAGLADECGTILAMRKFETGASDVYAHLARCGAELRECFAELSISMDSIAGVGVTLPGMVDKIHENLDNAVYSGWKDVPVRAFFQKLFGIEAVFIDNDVNACAVGEIAFGAGKQYSDFIWATVSTGVGGAVVSGGRLLEGYNNFAGEIGHVKVEYENPMRCPCGQYGCLEAHGSGSAITREALRLTKENSGFAALFKERGLAVDAIGCAVLAEEGVIEALELYRQAGIYLGRGFSYAINLLNTQAIIIGGGIANSLEIIEPAVREAIGVCVAPPLAGVDIIKTKLGYQAAFLGAAALVSIGKKVSRYE